MGRRRGIVTVATLALWTSACGTVPMAAIAPIPATVSQQNVFGRRVTSLVTDIVVAYDHNRNGAIELERPTGGSLWSRIGNFLFWRDERVRSTRTTTQTHEELTITTRVYTRFPLFMAADTNHDRRLTQDELQALVQTYDTDSDGSLDARGWRFWHAKNEIERFNADYGERLLTYRELDLPAVQPAGGQAVATGSDPSTSSSGRGPRPFART